MGVPQCSREPPSCSIHSAAPLRRGIRHKKKEHTIIIEIAEHITEVVEDILKKVKKLAGEGEGNHTLRWDMVLDSTNGRTEAGAEGCNSDRFKCIFPTAAFPDGEAVLDMQTGIVWDRAPHDTRGGMDADAGDLQTWSTARFQCANRVIGGQKGNRLPSHSELASLVDLSGTGVDGAGIP